MIKFQVGKDKLSTEKLYEIGKLGGKLVLSPEVREKLQYSRIFLEDKIQSGAVIYGVNTGFGDLCASQISPEELEQLQYNLIRSHSCGTGPVLPYTIARMILALKIHNLAQAWSGASTELVERLILFWDAGLAPKIHILGSLGASGDLAPLASLAAPLRGEGTFLNHEGNEILSADWHRLYDLQPIKLKSKEGIALLNGTQFMSACGSYALCQSKNLLSLAIESYVLSLWSYGANSNSLKPEIHFYRPHPGQIEIAHTALKLFNLLPEREFQTSLPQDPYSFRCMPQVVGASLDALNYTGNILNTELNSFTDNPLVLQNENLILSGGNFHGQPLALAFDFASIALAELGSISERRQFRLLSGKNGLPKFLADKPGIESGYMIVQYTSAALVSHNKQMCTPASADNIETSDGQEDHVSMGANAVNKWMAILDNTKKIIAYEWLMATRACTFRHSKHKEVIAALPHGAMALDFFPPHYGDVWMNQRLRNAEKFIDSASL